MTRMGRSVAILIDSLAGGGAERSVLTLAAALEAKGVDVELFALKSTCDYDDVASVRVHLVEGAWGARGATLTERATALETKVADVERRRGSPFDLFLVNLERTSEVVVRTRLKPAFHVLHSSVGSNVRAAFRHGPFRFLRVRRRFDALAGQHLIAVSDDLRREAESDKRRPAASVRRIYNPVDVDSIRALARESVAGIPDEPYVIHVGRRVHPKRHDILFRAFRRVPERYKLVCLSNHTERLQRDAKRYGIAGRLITPGFQQNPYAWMARARLLVLSSDYEGLSRVLVEALVCGTPVVTTLCPGVPEILGQELNHWSVPARRPDLLGDKITEALATEIDLSGWRLIDEIGTERIADQYLALLDAQAATP